MNEQIDVIVRYWSKFLERTVKHDAGRDAVMINLTYTILSKQAKPLSKRKINAFRTCFRKILESRFKYQSAFMLVYDYGPPIEIEMAAKIAGIDEVDGRFPVKTKMRVTPDSITVSEGYAAPFREIWSAR